ncbi:hypothetical protein [Nakamurella endophytica]|uniref:Uncharacterized protein n=1 Tax=Nakamurella endophytica TaxID=1748367 RepID=A0A917WAC8_9ACTN|nr:hypothetical protein [Nakamurella endophytica]GGL88345.1 hypothetical protein GCM10011594_04980 [Nakamurella endophytica]
MAAQRQTGSSGRRLRWILLGAAILIIAIVVVVVLITAGGNPTDMPGTRN